MFIKSYIYNNLFSLFNSITAFSDVYQELNNLTFNLNYGPNISHICLYNCRLILLYLYTSYPFYSTCP